MKTCISMPHSPTATVGWRFILVMMSLSLASTHTWAIGLPPNAYTYDVNNRLTQVTYADGRQVSYTYDAMGNLTSVKTRTGAPPVVLIGDTILGAVGHAIADYAIQSNRPADVTGYLVKGLPKGLKVNATLAINADGKPPGTIYGTPTVGGVFKVTVSLKSTTGTGATSILTANIDNPFATLEDGFNLAGGLSGALDASALSSGELGGWLSLKTTTGGTFSGSLQLGGLKYAIKGFFDGETGNAQTITILRKTPLPNLTLNLSLILTGATRGEIAGTLTDGSTLLTLQINREVWGKTNLATMFSGPVSTNYNMALNVEGAHQGDDDYPQGFGYGTTTIAKTGSAKTAGKLADGTAFTASRIIWPDGTLPIFVPLYANKGVLNGAILIGQGTDYSTADNPIQGQAFWKRPASTKATDRLYALGFETQTDIAGGAYTPPPKGYRVLALGNGVSHSAIQLELNDGGLTSQLTTALTISTANKVPLFTPNDHAYGLSFVPTSGIFSASFTMTSPTRRVAILGLIVPDVVNGTSNGFGYFLLPGATATTPILSGNGWIGPPP
jgi:YD repeat-containing protein